MSVLLIGGLLQDLTDLMTYRGTDGPDRSLFGWDEEIIDRLASLVLAPALANAATTLVIVLLGFAFLRYSWQRTELRPAALILALASLDSLPLAVVPAAVSDVYFAFYWPALFAALVRFTAVFPVRQRPAHLHPPVRVGTRMARLRRAPARALHSLDRALLHPAVVWGGAMGTGLLIYSVVRPWAEGPRPPGSAVAAAIVLAVLVVYAAAAVRYVRRGYAIAQPRDQRRSLWIVQGALLYCIGFLVLLSAGTIVARVLGEAARPVLYAVLDGAYLVVVAGAVVSLGVAVFYDGAVDPALVVRRTTLYGAAGILAVFAVGVVDEIVESTVAAWLGWSDGLGALAAAGLAAVLFALVGGHVRRRLGGWLQRALPGRDEAAERQSG